MVTTWSKQLGGKSAQKSHACGEPTPAHGWVRETETQGHLCPWRREAQQLAQAHTVLTPESEPRGRLWQTSAWIPSRPCGAPGHKTSVSPIPLIKGNSLLSASMTFSGFQWADSSSCESGKGEDIRPGRNNQEHPWGKVLASHQGIYDHIFELFCRYWNPLQKGELND